MDLPTSFPENSSNFSDYDDPQTDVCDVSDINVDWVYTGVPVYIYVSSALGILFNLVVLLVFLLHKKACTVAEIYLSNMAAADFVLMFSLFFHAANISNEFQWLLGAHMCPIVYFCIIMNYNCSIFFLVLVSIDRYLALVHPLLQCKMRKQKYAKLNCLLVWIFGFLLGIPTVMCRQVREQFDTIQYNETFESDAVTQICLFTCPQNVYLTNMMIQIIFSFIIPILILLFCTVKIVHSLNKRQLRGASAQKMEHKATILVLVVLLAFLICWLPITIVKIIYLYLRFEIDQDHCTLWKNMFICQNLFTYLAFFNSDLNPVLYVMIGKSFRKSLHKVCLNQSQLTKKLPLYINVL